MSRFCAGVEGDPSVPTVKANTYMKAGGWKN